ncbi:glycogen/starch synthase, partial [uncultured Methylobacterium sp.]|uniref:glycogen/starch synthase n=1 Tax=uncultured Methylobacterium sp. TaxID=157278 RepID=UPI002588E37C
MTFPASARLAWHSPAVSSGGSPREAVEGLRGSLKPRILYATPEMADFVKTGGLGEVAASLPRALRQHYDVRILIPGYRQVVERHPEIAVVAHLPGDAEMPPCDLGLIETGDGLPVYVILNSA